MRVSGGSMSLRIGRRWVGILAALAMLGLMGSSGAAQDRQILKEPERTEIVGMNTPALSPDGRVICFSYRGDLWTVSAEGGEARRLTIHPAHDAYPRWSPDGAWIAFASSRYPSQSSNYDVFIMPSSGGEPRRLTYHTANDYPCDWSADGKRILLQAIRQRDGWQAIELDIETGRTRSLTSERGLVRYAAYSPDNKRIAYALGARTATWWRPLYRGSANMDIWVKDLEAGSVQRVSTYEGMDMWPMFSADGASVCYVSDVLTPGAPNLVMAALREPRPVRLTGHEVGAVTWPSIARDGRHIVYLHEGSLYLYSFERNSSRKVTVMVASDVATNRVRRVTLRNGATELEVAPDGETLGLVVRGDVWSVPAKGGEAERLTRDPSHDYDFVWSPDGKSIAFVSDRSGAFGVYVMDAKTHAVRPVAVGEHESGSPQFSPDNKYISWLASGPEGGLYTAPVDGSGPPVRVAHSAGNNRFGVGIASYAWSPDGRWLAFSRRDRRNTTDIWIVPAVGGEAVNVTRYPGSNDAPRWSSDGKFLVFLSSRERSQGMDLYALPLLKPSRRESTGSGGEGREVRIDFEDIHLRARRLTTLGVTAFELSPDGKMAFGLASFGAGPDVFAVPLGGGPLQRLSTTGDHAGPPRFGAKASGRFWCLTSGGGVRSYAQQAGGWQPSAVSFEAFVELDRGAELRQSFHEFWRSIRSGFYDPDMHGVDWTRVRERYERLLAGVETPEEFAFFVLAPMAGELNASHMEILPPTRGDEPEVAELGLEYDETHDGPGVRVTGFLRDGPASDNGPLIKPGEYILRIQGEEVTWGERLWKALAGRAGKETELVVNASPSEEGARTLKITPAPSQRIRELRYEEEVRQARAAATRLSGGRVAYIRIQAMDPPSLSRFERELWSETEGAEALVLDVRDNGGGSTHDAVLATLSRTLYGFTKPRDGEPSTQPWRLWTGPIALLVNENSASDTELLALGFQHLRLGPVIGRPTPGYVIGTYSATLQDGTSYRIPMWGWYDVAMAELENRGVKPDILVENGAAEPGSPEDRQLQEAVKELLRLLEKPEAGNGKTRQN